MDDYDDDNREDECVSEDKVAIAAGPVDTFSKKPMHLNATSCVGPTAAISTNHVSSVPTSTIKKNGAVAEKKKVVMKKSKKSTNKTSYQRGGHIANRPGGGSSVKNRTKDANNDLLSKVEAEPFVAKVGAV